MVAEPTRNRLPVTIGERKFAIDLGGYQREPVDSSRQMVDQGSEPGEQSLSNRGIWKRTSEDFHHGVGQVFFDHGEEGMRSRYQSSVGLDPWTRHELSLVHRTRRPLASAGLGAPFAFGAGDVVTLPGATNQRFITSNPAGTGLRFWWIAGGAIVEVDDPTQETWVMAQVNWTVPIVNHFSSVVTDGTDLFACNGLASNVVQRITGSGAGTGNNFGVELADLLGYCNGRLLAAQGPEICELDAVGAKVDIYTHFNASFEWVKFLGAPNGIYCAGNNGRAGEIYLCTVADQTGAIIAPYHVGSLPNGETVNSIEYYGGVLIIATSKGLRLGAIQGSGFLSIGPLIPIGGTERRNTVDACLAADASITFEDIGPAVLPVNGCIVTIDGEQVQCTSNPNVFTGATNVTRGVRGSVAGDHLEHAPAVIQMPPSPVTGLECQGQFVWFTLNQFSGSASYIGRLDLSHFTGELRPAWAPDLSAVATNAVSAPITWRDPVTGADRRIFASQNAGPNVEYDAFASSGEYRSGRITFGTPELKAFLSLEVWTDPLPVGAVIIPLVLDSSGLRHQLPSISTDGGKYTKIDLGTLNGGDGLEDEWLEVHLAMTCGTGGLTTPIIQRWTLRGMPLPIMSEEIKFPVILKPSVNDDDQLVTISPWGDWDYLHQLYLNRSRINFTMGNESATVRIDGLSMSRFDPEMVEIDKWTPDRDWVEAIWFVTLLTVDGGT